MRVHFQEIHPTFISFFSSNRNLLPLHPATMSKSLLTMWKLTKTTNLFEFPTDPPLELIPIDDQSTLAWCPHYLNDAECAELLKHLMSTLHFEQSVINLRGNKVVIPRLQSWFADADVVVQDLYQSQKQYPWTELMLKLKHQLEKQLKCTFVYCLVNYYRDGKDHIGFHSDKEVQGVVASVSLGVARRFLLHHYSVSGKTTTWDGGPLTSPSKVKYEFSLTNGSMVAMMGGTQKYWKVGWRGV